MSLPPGPRRPAVLQSLAWIHSLPDFLRGCRDRFGGTFTVCLAGGPAHVLVSAPADVELALSGPTETFLMGRANRMFRGFLGERSVVMLDGEEHRRRRKLLMPAFHGERMKAYATSIRDIATEHLRNWTPGRRIVLLRSMREITLGVILRAIFGVFDPGRAELIGSRLAFTASNTAAVLAFLPSLQKDWGRWSPWGRMLRARRELRGFFDEEIERARREVGTRQDILARLVEETEHSGQPLSTEELQDELQTLVAAGYVTTASALAWAFQWILGLQEVREPLLAELNDVVGGGPVHAEHLPRLKFLESVLDEALRLHPPIPVLRRWLASDVSLGPWTLPAGTLLCPSPYLAHRDPQHYPDPDRFIPDRFLKAPPEPYRFIPFGAGPRTCMGLAFAMFEMKIVVATILSSVALRLDAAPTHAARRDGILAPLHGTPVTVESRLRERIVA